MSTRLQIILVSVIALMAGLGFTATALVLQTPRSTVISVPPGTQDEETISNGPSDQHGTSTIPNDLEVINAIRQFKRLPLGDGGEMVFVGRGVKNSDGIFPYEFWHVTKEGWSNLLEAGKGESYCSTQDAVVNADGLIKFSLWNSPCEAGYTQKDFYYDQSDGQRVFTTTFNSFTGVMTYKKERSPQGEMQLTLEFDGACSGNASSPAPSVVLKGIHLRELAGAGSFDQVFPLPDQTMACQQAYGGDWVNPIFFGAAMVDGQGLSIKLPDQHIVQFNLALPENDPAFFTK